MKLPYKLIGSLGLGVLLYHIDRIKLARLIWYNFSNITDYKIFPYRTIHKSSTPYFFSRNLGQIQIISNEIFDVKKFCTLESFLSYHKTVAFIIYHKGEIIYEQYFDNYNESSIVPSFSMAKSIIGLLIGLAIEDKLIESEHDSIIKYLPELKKSPLSKLTIMHLLQMTSQLDFNENYANPFGEAATFYYGTRLMGNTLNLNLKGIPGKSFEYNSGNTQLLGSILDRVLGESTISKYFETRIWSKIGSNKDATWSLDKKINGIEKTFCCFNSTPIDFLKLGKLLLQEGKWNDETIIPKSWIDKIRGTDTSLGACNEYQYHFWKIPENNSFMAKGHLGQYIFIDPKSDAVLLRLGKAKAGLDWPKI